MPWAAAVALGAIVSPPDAAAAMAVLRQLRPPHRILTILEGESLLNDASALLIYRLAVGAVAMQVVLGSGASARRSCWSSPGSIVAGLRPRRGCSCVDRTIRDVPTAIILQFVSHLRRLDPRRPARPLERPDDGRFAITVARRAPERTPARLRLPSYAVWETAVFVLNVLAFVFIGLQIRPILAGLEPDVRLRYLRVAGSVLLTVIVVRISG